MVPCHDVRDIMVRYLHWNFDAIYHSSRDISTSGLVGHIAISGCRSLSQWLRNTFFDVDVVRKLDFVTWVTTILIMACHILYGRPYCDDAKEGVGGITPPKFNRGGWNSARTKYFEGNVVCKNLGAIGWGATERRRKTSLGDPKKLDYFFVDTTTHDLTHFPSADFHEIFARTRGSVLC